MSGTLAENAKPMTDAELIAYAALANIEAIVMAGDNAQRAMEGYSPAWREGTGLMYHSTRLADELYRRRVAVEAKITESRPGEICS